MFAARKARKFAVESALIYVAEAQMQYISAISKLPRFKHLHENWKDDSTAKAARVSDICTEIMITDDFLVPAVSLMLHWRNRVVHPNSNAQLTHQEKEQLRNNEAIIAKNYKDLSVDCLLCHFKERRPTLKDVSSLISMAINLTRKIDSQVFTAFSKEDLQAWLDHYGITAELEKVKKETSPQKVTSSIRRVFKAHAPSLLDMYEKYFALDEI